MLLLDKDVDLVAVLLVCVFHCALHLVQLTWNEGVH